MTNNSNKQIQHATEFIAAFVNHNIDTLRAKGIVADIIYSAYLASTLHPMGKKSFFPLIQSLGFNGFTLERVKKQDGTFYILMAD